MAVRTAWALRRGLAAQGVAVDNAGNVYVADSRNYTIRKVKPSGSGDDAGGQGWRSW